MNHFEFYNLPVQFYLDEDQLKETFYTYSRQYHPDHHTLEDATTQSDNLQKASQNNEAYKTLKDFFKRLKYVLEIRGLMEANTQNDALPQSFLMEMMDVNEEVMDLQMEDNPAKKEALLASIFELEKNLFAEIRNTLIQHDSQPNQEHDLSAVKLFYLKRQYLLRIQENLTK